MVSPAKPKKMKFKKSFSPLSLDEGDEFFPNGFFEFNVSKLLTFIQSNLEQFPIKEVAVREYAIWEQTRLDEATVFKANIKNPILLAEISPGRFSVIDGNHRLERAKRDGVETLPAYQVSAQEHILFLTSEKAYRAYIQYWNAKVDEWES